jgi:hypothetical protein
MISSGNNTGVILYLCAAQWAVQLAPDTVAKASERIYLWLFITLYHILL